MIRTVPKRMRPDANRLARRQAARNERRRGRPAYRAGLRVEFANQRKAEGRVK